MITIAKANNASYVTISESPVRMKSHRHQLLSSEFERSKEKLFLSSNEKGATATVVVFLRVLPFGETFSILRRVSGFVKKKRASLVLSKGFSFYRPLSFCLRKTGDRWSPLRCGVFREQGFCVENKRKGVCPCACNARGVVIY